MKRRFISLAISLLVLTSSFLTVHALSQRVHDEAGLMSYEEIAGLDTLAEEVSASTGLDLVILTVDSLEGRSPSAYADDYYDRNGYDADGMLFMLAMQERDWYISTCGKAISIFDDKDIDTLLNAGLPWFSSGNYYEGFYEVLFEVEKLSEDHSAGQSRKPAPASPAAAVSGRMLLISAVIGAAISGIIILIMRSAMNTKRKQRSAADYLTPGSYHLRTRQDIFLYSNVTKTPRQQSSGSTHGSSSGRSHGGGGRKF